MKRMYFVVVTLIIVFLILTVGIYFLNRKFDLIDIIDEKIHGVSTTEHHSTDGIEIVKEKMEILDLKPYLRRYDFSSSNIATYKISQLTKRNLEKLNGVIGNVELSTLTTNQKVKFDFDNDGDQEKIFVISNVENNKLSIWFSSVIYENDGEYQLILNDRYTSNDKEIRMNFTLVNIVDFNKDGLYELLINPTLIERENNQICDSLYELKNNKFQSVFDCDLVSS